MIMHNQMIRPCLPMMLAALLSLPQSAPARPARTADAVTATLPAPADSVRDEWDLDEVEMRADSVGRRHRNLAKGRNVYHYVLGPRYRKYGDSFSDGLADHLYLEAGLGVERIVPPTADYRYDALMGLHLGVGKQFDPLHGVRLMLHAARGYQREWDYTFDRIGAQADYLFSVTDYFNGYNPARRFSVQLVAGVGVQHARLPREDRSRWAAEVHVGPQLRFYTGPHGYLALSPYVGIGGDQMDLSEQHNWRRWDAFWGARLSYQYYLHNNLSREARRRALDGRSRANYLVADSLLQSWRMPWFVEASMGPGWLSNADESAKGQTLGSSLAIGVGRWFSPAIGLKLTAFSRSAVWRRDEYAPVYGGTAYARSQHARYAGGRFEALLDPLGFARNYNWDRPFGLRLALGVEYGQLHKYGATEAERLSCHALGYTGAVQVWGRLSRDLRLFVEPRYAYTMYHVPYTNVEWQERLSERSFGVDVGLTMMLRSMPYRRLPDPDLFLRHVHQIALGVAGGLNLMQPTGSTYEHAASPSWNGMAYAEYHLDYTHAVRLSAEMLSRNVAQIARFYDVYLPEGSDQPVGEMRQGLMDRDYRLLMASLSYDLNLTSVFSGHRPRRAVELEMYLGPTLAWVLNDRTVVDPRTPMDEGHTAQPLDPVERKMRWGATVGLKLMANLSRHWALTLTPSVQAIHGLDLPGMHRGMVLRRFSTFQTVSLGVQYKFQVFR